MCQSEISDSMRGSTHVPSPANRVSNRSYQQERVNVFVPPAYRQQLDSLRAEWRVPLAEAVRRVLGSGLRNIMQADSPTNGQRAISGGGNASDDC